MTRRALLNIALFALLLGLIAYNRWAAADASRPNFELLPQMAHGARYNTYSANPNFADGKTLQAPVVGTIARGEMPLHFGPGANEAARAARELVSPVNAADTQAHARGEHVFQNFCRPCHGADAAGMGSVTQRGVPPPPSLLAAHARDMKDGQMFHVLTFGQNNMAAYASQLSTDDRWNVIAYVRALQATHIKTPTPPLTASEKIAASRAPAAGGAQ
jgi:mono/diheme cytochrome c family protein